jgi:DNA-binding CsgD family transcriptional regulator
VLEHAVELYATLVGVVFAVAGVWMGQQWRARAESHPTPTPRGRGAVDGVSAVGDGGPTTPDLAPDVPSVSPDVPSISPGVPFVPDSAQVAALGLTPREMEILALVADGLATAEIAERAGVSVNTVKTHVARVLRKLGAERRTQAVLHARALGLVP